MQRTKDEAEKIPVIRNELQVLYSRDVLVITPYIDILYMTSITLTLVVLEVRRILLNYGCAGSATAYLKAAGEKFAHETI